MGAGAHRWIVALVVWGGAVLAAAAQPLQLQSGLARTEVAGQVTSAPVTLPYHWDRRHDGHPGRARFDLPFRLMQVPSVPWGLFIQRGGNALEVSLNGALLQGYGDLSRGGGADYAKSPLYLPVPAHLLHAGDNLLTVQIRADSGRNGGLSPVAIGPADEVRDQLFAPVYAWRHTGSVLLAGFSTVIGAIALALWFTQLDVDPAGVRVRQKFYMWAAFAELGWALRLADATITQPPLPWVAWGTLMAACYAGWAASVLLFCHYVARWFRVVDMRRMGPVLSFFTGTAVLACWAALQFHRPGWLTAWLAVELLAVGAYLAAFLLSTARHPDMRRVLMAVVAVFTLLMATRDWLVFRLDDSYGDVGWVRYTSVLFGITLLGVVGMRFRHASARAHDLLATLSARVAQREQELSATYAQLAQAEREQARVHERERILRDMHDGVGAHLSTAIRQLQAGQANPQRLLRTLRDSMDQLKLSLDAVRLPAGDVAGLLAMLRYRLEPRLADADLALDWAVDELAPLHRLDAPGLRHLQFLLLEAISNVLQHAQARVLRVEAAVHGQTLRLALIDDGRGFDAAQPPRSLRDRAQALGARLTVASRPGRTEVRLELDDQPPPG